MKRKVWPLLALVWPVLAAACGSGGGGAGDADAAAQAKRPITIWYSNNAEEVAWGKQMVAAWNAAHADQKVTAQEIPTGKCSEEVIGAAITAGNAPCLIFNTSPASVSQFQKQGGLVALDASRTASRTSRSGPARSREQYKSTDGKYYQLPWKDNPVMIFYNKKAFAKAGIDTANPPLATYDEFLATSRKLVAVEGREVRDLPGAEQRVLPVLVRLLPVVRGRERRQAAGCRRQGAVRVRRGQEGRRVLADDVRRQARLAGEVHR